MIRLYPGDDFSYSTFHEFMNTKILTPLLFLSLSFQLLASAAMSQDALEVSSWFVMKEGTRTGNVYVRAVMEPGYHCYSQTHGGIETKSSFQVAESDDYKVVAGWQSNVPPHVYEKDGHSHEEFEDEVTWSAPFVLGDGVGPDSLTIELSFLGQVCNASGCQAPKTFDLGAEMKGSESGLEVRAGDDSAGAPASEKNKEAKGSHGVVAKALSSADIAAMAQLYEPDAKINYEKLDGSSGVGTLWGALFGAFFGGMLLNLMPCVFPVLGLKVLGFVEQAGKDPKKIKLHGLAFAAGLIFSMWVLAGAILALKAFWGQEVQWGQQMGNPFFVGGIVILLFVLGLNLAGLFEMGMFMTRAGGKHKEGYSGSFISGIITTLVATPCSGPFLGAAMGYTLSQTAPIAMIIFTVFGLGIAVPYLVLSYMPALIYMLPRPGAWMETFKKLMAFTLFAAAAFFIKSFGTQTGVEGLSWLLMALVVISVGAFFYGKWSPAYIAAKKRYIWGWAIPLLIVAAGGWMYYSAARTEAPLLAAVHGDWDLWTPGIVESRLADNKPVWVDYTASW